MSDVDTNTPSSESPTCPICLNDLESAGEVARPSVCGHPFCRSCLESLCRQEPSLRRCPLDRKPFDHICVRRWGETAETVLMVDTLTPLQKILPSHAVAIGLGGYLLAVLWLSPSWLLAAHIATVGCIYCFTAGVQDWEYYTICSFAFYAIFLAWKLIGFFVSIYALCCGALVVYWCQQIPRMQAAGHWRQDKLLLIGTCVVISVFYPALIFSLYELAQIYCYVLWLILIYNMHSNLFAAFARHALLLSHQYARYALLLSILVLAPFLCRLPELTLPLLIYNCLAAGYLGCSYGPETAANNLQREFFFLNMGLVKVVCQVVVCHLLGLSVWPVVYSILVSEYCAYCLLSTSSSAAPQMESNFPWVSREMFQSFLSLINRSPLLVAVHCITMLILVPCQMFGFLTYVGSFIFNLLLGGIMYFLLFKLLPTRPNFVTIGIVIQLTALGVLVPAVFLPTSSA